MLCMDCVALALCREVAGAELAFVQSDEVSVSADRFSQDRDGGMVRREPAEDRFGVRVDGHSRFQSERL